MSILPSSPYLEGSTLDRQWRRTQKPTEYEIQAAQDCQITEGFEDRLQDMIAGCCWQLNKIAYRLQLAAAFFGLNQLARLLTNFKVASFNVGAWIAFSRRR